MAGVSGLLRKGSLKLPFWDIINISRGLIKKVSSIWGGRLLIYSLASDNVSFEPDMSNCGREQSLTITDREGQRAAAPTTSGLLLQGGSQSPEGPHPCPQGVASLQGQSDDNKVLTFREPLLCIAHGAKHCGCTILILAAALKRTEHFYPRPASEGTESQNASGLPGGTQPANSRAGLPWAGSRACAPGQAVSLPAEDRSGAPGPALGGLGQQLHS